MRRSLVRCTQSGKGWLALRARWGAYGQDIPLARLAGPGQPLEHEPPDAFELEGLIRSGTARPRDAESAPLSLESCFDLACNAAHALCLAALRHRGFRPRTATSVPICAVGTAADLSHRSLRETQLGDWIAALGKQQVGTRAAGAALAYRATPRRLRLWSKVDGTAVTAGLVKASHRASSRRLSTCAGGKRGASMAAATTERVFITVEGGM